MTWMFTLWFWFGIVTSHLCFAWPDPSTFSTQDVESFVTLRAVTKTSALNRRRADLDLGRDVVLVYANVDNFDGQDSVLATTVQLESSNPVLLLEEFDNVLSRVACTAETITAEFMTLALFESAKDSWTDLEGGHVVVSHSPCAEEGVRIPFYVRSVTWDEEDQAISLSVERKAFHQAFHSVTISHGASTVPRELRRYDKLGRRQEESASTTRLDVDKTSIIPTATGSPTATALSIDLSHASTDDWFPGLTEQAQFTLGCNECRTEGTLEFSQSEWSIDFPDNLDNFSAFDEVTDMIQTGWVRLKLKDFVARVDLQLSPSLSGALELPFFSVPVFGFAVPLLGVAGIVFEPAVALDWSLVGGIELTYGFELNVPDLDILVDFRDPASSVITGLDSVAVAAIPFQANTSDIALSLTLAFRPRIEIVASLFDNAFVLGSGVYFNLPSGTADVVQLDSNTHDADCNGVSRDPSVDAWGEFKDAFQNLTSITASFQVDVGVDVLADVPLAPLPKFYRDFNLASTTLASLPTACLVYDAARESGQRFVPADEALAQVQEETAEAEDEDGGGSVSGSGGADTNGMARGESAIALAVCAAVLVGTVHLF